jgi:hypothetical protein
MFTTREGFSLRFVVIERAGFTLRCETFDYQEIEGWRQKSAAGCGDHSQTT